MNNLIAAINGLSTDSLQSILVHELAHVRCYEVSVNLLQMSLNYFRFLWASNVVSQSPCRSCAGPASVGAPVHFRRAGLGLSLIAAGLMIEPAQQGSMANDAVDATVMLEFPTDRSVGMVHSRPAMESDFGVSENLYEGWQPIGPARGTIEIPKDHHVRLSVSQSGATDLRFLHTLHRKPIVALTLEGTEIGDRQFPHVSALSELRWLQAGHIPITDQGTKQLHRLKKLQRLDLSAFRVERDGFGVGDETMSVVAKLPALERIKLRLTKVTEAGLARLTECSNLRSISIEGTAVTDDGLLHLLKLPNLESLSLGVYGEGADISDDGLKVVGKLTKLQWLNLSGTPVTNEGLKHLSGLLNLRYLSLDNTQSDEDGLQYLTPLKSLERIRLYDTLTDRGAAYLAKLRNLRAITGYLDLTDKGVSELSRLEFLEQLTLSGERVTNSSIDSIIKMKSLKRLRFHRCSISDAGVARLIELSRLERLAIRDTLVTTACVTALREIDSLKALSLIVREIPGHRLDWSHLADLHQIKDLELGGASIGNRDLLHIRNLHQLTKFEFDADEPLSDEGIGFLSGLTNLKSIRINDSVVTDQGLQTLAGMTKLEYLTFPCLATDEGLMALRSLKSLRHLQIASPYITDQGVMAVAADLPSLQRTNRFTYRSSGDEVIFAESDPYWRSGSAAERDELNALEGNPPPPLQVAGWINGGALPVDENGSQPGQIEELKGKVILVDIWGQWCGPCIAQIPTLKELYAKYQDDGFEIIGVHSTIQAEGLAEFVAQQEIKWPICIDVEKRTRNSWRLSGYPACYLIDRSGKMRIADIHRPHLEKAIQALLKEPLDNDNQRGRVFSSQTPD